MIQDHEHQRVVRFFLQWVGGQRCSNDQQRRKNSPRLVCVGSTIIERQLQPTLTINFLCMQQCHRYSSPLCPTIRISIRHKFVTIRPLIIYVDLKQSPLINCIRCSRRRKVQVNVACNFDTALLIQQPIRTRLKDSRSYVVHESISNVLLAHTHNVRDKSAP